MTNLCVVLGCGFGVLALRVLSLLFKERPHAGALLKDMARQDREDLLKALVIALLQHALDHGRVPPRDNGTPMR